MRGLILILGLVLAACGGRPTATPAGHTVQGTVSLTIATAAGSPFSDCHGMGGFDDIRSGANVVLKDATGTIVGSAVLPRGKIDAVGCSFTFSMADVADSTFYVVTIGRRSGPTYQRAEMVARGWALDLTLGDAP